MVTLSSEAAWGHAAPRGATLPGRRVRETEAAATRHPRRRRHRDQWGDSRAGGGLGRQPAEGGGVGSGRRSGCEPRGLQRTRGLGGGGRKTWNLSPRGAPRCAGEGPPLRGSQITPGPPGAPPGQPGTFARGQTRLRRPPTGTPGTPRARAPRPHAPPPPPPI